MALCSSSSPSQKLFPDFHLTEIKASDIPGMMAKFAKGMVLLPLLPLGIMLSGLAFSAFCYDDPNGTKVERAECIAMMIVLAPVSALHDLKARRSKRMWSQPWLYLYPCRLIYILMCMVHTTDSCVIRSHLFTRNSGMPSCYMGLECYQDQGM